MKKISTLFKKDPNDLGRVINEINPENSWVFDEGVKATRKFDGTACAIINGELYKRYDVKKGKAVPEGSIPCQDPDPISGHHPHWLKCRRDEPGDKYFWEAFDSPNNLLGWEDWTYELCGPKIQGNPELFEEHTLEAHGEIKESIPDLSFEGIKEYLSQKDIEGIVFHHPDGRMCKIRKSDFGMKRKTEEFQRT